MKSALDETNLSSAWGAFALCVLLAVSVACEDDDGPTGIDDDVETVEFTTTGPINLEVGSTSQLAFEILNVDGELIDPDDVDVVFTSSHQTVATVSIAGLVTPVAPGTTSITIRVGTISDAITVQVGPEISSIDIGEVVDLVSGETVGLDIAVLNAAGNPVTDPGLTFTTSNAAVVTVNGDGVLTAVSAGTATITAAGGGESDSTDVTVFAAASGGISLGGNAFTAMVGDSFTISDLVIVRDVGGVLIPDPELAFEITDPAGVATGMATITATNGALTTFSVITVQ